MRERDEGAEHGKPEENIKLGHENCFQIRWKNF